MNALAVRQLVKTYRNGVQALKGIDLDVERGDFFALLGPNGAGKTTLIGILTSLVSKTSGSLSVFGYDIDRDLEAAKARIFANQTREDTAIVNGDDPLVAAGWVDRALPALKAAGDAEGEAYALNTYQTVSRLMAGGKIGAEASLNKIFWSELDGAMHRTAMQLLGAAAELRHLGDGAMNDWLEGYMFSLSGAIYAGSNEIQRNITAERLLGLPRVGAG